MNKLRVRTGRCISGLRNILSINMAVTGNRVNVESEEKGNWGSVSQPKLWSQPDLGPSFCLLNLSHPCLKQVGVEDGGDGLIWTKLNIELIICTWKRESEQRDKKRQTQNPKDGEQERRNRKGQKERMCFEGTQALGAEQCEGYSPPDKVRYSSMWCY